MAEKVGAILPLQVPHDLCAVRRASNQYFSIGRMLSTVPEGSNLDSKERRDNASFSLRQLVAETQFRVADKQAVDKLESAHFVSYNSKTSFSWLNIALVQESLSESQTREILETLNKFYGPTPYCLFTSNTELSSTCKSMKQQSNPEKSLMGALDVDGMILDLVANPAAFKPAKFPDSHPASKLRFEVVTDRTSVIDYVRLVFEVFVGVVPTDEQLNETVESYLRIKRDETPKYISFVGYEDGVAVATGSVVIDKDAAAACIIEIISASRARGKGYGAAIFSKCVEAAVSNGSKRVVLTASDEGRPVYERQDFQTVAGGPFSMFYVEH
eukprot:TRINITY_DN9821_c0_g1_i1.p1 TRINITY_DN9821_c0_g1~~TRINITY_DN9821_c0_g1_i1.p1  ORF type:complete len:328 (-),score=64.81 TRINITY_DN9821_c0_g1_i1:30-1013(-)